MNNKDFYRAFWRWHFYAGLVVIPFLFLLAASGILMLLGKQIDAATLRPLTHLEPDGTRLQPSEQFMRVRAAFPEKQVNLFIPPAHEDGASQFSLTDGHAQHGGHNAPSTTVFIDPYSGEILGTLDPSTTLYTKIKAFHSSLYLGVVGETLIEISAGLVVLILKTAVNPAKWVFSVINSSLLFWEFRLRSVAGQMNSSRDVAYLFSP